MLMQSTIEKPLHFVNTIPRGLICLPTTPWYCPPPPSPYPASLSLIHLSPLVSINTPHSPLQKPDSHWFSDLYTHNHHPLRSSCSLLLPSMLLYCPHPPSFPLFFFSPSMPPSPKEPSRLIIIITLWALVMTDWRGFLLISIIRIVTNSKTQSCGWVDSGN